MIVISDFKNMLGNLWKYKLPDIAKNSQSYTENAESEEMRSPGNLEFEEGIEAQRFFEEHEEAIDASEGGDDYKPPDGMLLLEDSTSEQVPQNDVADETSPGAKEWYLKNEEPYNRDGLRFSLPNHGQVTNTGVCEPRSLTKDNNGTSQDWLSQSHEAEKSFEDRWEFNSLDSARHMHILQDEIFSVDEKPQNDGPNGTSLEPTKWCLKFEKPCLADELDTPYKYQRQENLNQDRDGASQGCLNEAHEIFEGSHVQQDGKLSLHKKPHSNGLKEAPETKRCSQNEESNHQLSLFYADCNPSKAESVLGTAQPQLVLSKGLNQQIYGARLKECLNKDTRDEDPLHWTKVSLDKSSIGQMLPEQLEPCQKPFRKKVSPGRWNSGNDDQEEFSPGQRYPRYKLPEQLNLKPGENGLAEVVTGPQKFLDINQPLYCFTVKIWDCKSSMSSYYRNWHEHSITGHPILVNSGYKNIIYNINSQNGFGVSWFRKAPTHFWICPLCTYVAQKIRPLNHCVLRHMKQKWNIDECPCELCCQYQIRIISSGILENCMLVHGNLSKPKLNWCNVSQYHMFLSCQNLCQNTQLGATAKTHIPTTACTSMSNGKEDINKDYPGDRNIRKQDILINGYVVHRSANLLGRGAFGLVFQATRKRDNAKVALKMAKVKHIYEWVRCGNRKIPLEVFILSKLRNATNIVQLLDAFIIKDSVILIFPRDGSMDLSRYLLIYGPLSEVMTKCIFIQILHAVGSCWSRGIVHRDLKSQNIIINQNTGMVQVIDFGSAVIMDEHEDAQRSFTGTRAICPPEYFIEDLYIPEPATVWSLGIILFDMVHNTVPFVDEEDIVEVNFVDKEKVEVSKDCNHLITNCFNYNYEKRIKLASIRSHPWLEILPDLPILRNIILPISIPGSDQLPWHIKYDDIDGGNKDEKEGLVDNTDQICKAIVNAEMVSCYETEQHSCKREAEQIPRLGNSNYIFYILFVFLLLVGKCETYLKNYKIVCMGNCHIYMPEYETNKLWPTQRIPHAEINVKLRHTTFPIDEKRDEHNMQSQFKTTRFIESNRLEHCINTKYLKLSLWDVYYFPFLFCQHSAQQMWDGCGINVGWMRNQCGNELNLGSTFYYPAQLDKQTWPLQLDTVVKVYTIVFKEGTVRPPQQRNISWNIWSCILSMRTLLAENMLSSLDCFIIFLLLNMAAYCGLSRMHQSEGLWLMFSSGLAGYCLGLPGPALPPGRDSSLPHLLPGQVLCHYLDCPSRVLWIFIHENVASKSQNLFTACLCWYGEVVPHWVSQQPTCFSAFLKSCSYIIFLLSWASLLWLLAVVTAKHAATMDGTETPWSVGDKYVLNKSLLESTIELGENVKNYLSSENISQDIKTFGQMLTCFKEIIMKKKLYYASNPRIIKPDQNLELLVNQKALSVDQFRDALLQEVKITKTDSSGRVKITNIAELVFKPKDEKFRIKPKLRKLITGSSDDCVLSYTQICSLLSKYIIERREELFDSRNIWVVVCQNHPLGLALESEAFHRREVQELLRNQLIPDVRKLTNEVIIEIPAKSRIKGMKPNKEILKFIILVVSTLVLLLTLFPKVDGANLYKYTPRVGKTCPVENIDFNSRRQLYSYEAAFYESGLTNTTYIGNMFDNQPTFNYKFHSSSFYPSDTYLEEPMILAEKTARCEVKLHSKPDDGQQSCGYQIFDDHQSQTADLPEDYALLGQHHVCQNVGQAHIYGKNTGWKGGKINVTVKNLNSSLCSSFLQWLTLLTLEKDSTDAFDLLTQKPKNLQSNDFSPQSGEAQSGGLQSGEAQSGEDFQPQSGKHGGSCIFFSKWPLTGSLYLSGLLVTKYAQLLKTLMKNLGENGHPKASIMVGKNEKNAEPYYSILTGFITIPYLTVQIILSRTELDGPQNVDEANTEVNTLDEANTYPTPGHPMGNVIHSSLGNAEHVFYIQRQIKDDNAMLRHSLAQLGIISRKRTVAVRSIRASIAVIQTHAAQDFAPKHHVSGGSMGDPFTLEDTTEKHNEQNTLLEFSSTHRRLLVIIYPPLDLLSSGYMGESCAWGMEEGRQKISVDNLQLESGNISSFVYKIFFKGVTDISRLRNVADRTKLTTTKGMEFRILSQPLQTSVNDVMLPNKESDTKNLEPQNQEISLELTVCTCTEELIPLELKRCQHFIPEPDAGDGVTITAMNTLVVMPIDDSAARYPFFYNLGFARNHAAFSTYLIVDEQVGTFKMVQPKELELINLLSISLKGKQEIRGIACPHVLTNTNCTVGVKYEIPVFRHSPIQAMLMGSIGTKVFSMDDVVIDTKANHVRLSTYNALKKIVCFHTKQLIPILEFAETVMETYEDGRSLSHNMVTKNISLDLWEMLHLSDSKGYNTLYHITGTAGDIFPDTLLIFSPVTAFMFIYFNRVRYNLLLDHLWTASSGAHTDTLVVKDVQSHLSRKLNYLAVMAQEDSTRKAAIPSLESNLFATTYGSFNKTLEKSLTKTLNWFYFPECKVVRFLYKLKSAHARPPEDTGWMPLFMESCITLRVLDSPDNESSHTCLLPSTSRSRCAMSTTGKWMMGVSQPQLASFTKPVAS